MALFKSKLRKPEAKKLQPFDLNTPLFYLAPDQPWTLRDACEGCQVFGSTGSGKTSGSGKTLAYSFLRNGFGGLVLTDKPGDVEEWKRFAAECDRTEQLIIFGPNEDWRFNFLDYELNRAGAGAGLTENVVKLFTTVMEMAEREQSGGGNESFWQNTTKQMLKNAVDLLSIARGTLTLSDINAVISSAPANMEETDDEGWQQSSLCLELILEANAKAEAGTLTSGQEQDFDLTASYWLSEFPSLAEKTRSVIVANFTSMADCFLRGTLRDLFCTKTNLVPEMTHNGAIIVIDLPVKEYAELGQYAQALFKLAWQRATERRNVEASPRPVFLWADESQTFANKHDAKFQTTARSSRACTVYLTQNLPNYYASFGGANGKHQVDSLLGNLQTKIFHANGDPVTNKWAADVITKTWQTRANVSTSIHGARPGASHGHSEALEWQVIPNSFTTLRKGGPDNELLVDAIVFQAGRVCSTTGATFFKTTFKQG